MIRGVTIRGGAAVLAAALAPPAAAGDAALDPRDTDVGQLVEAEGAGLTYDTCTACHSEMIVAQQGLTREGWDKLLHWMVEKQGMAPIEAPDRRRILDYLATHYNTDRPNFPR